VKLTREKKQRIQIKDTDQDLITKRQAKEAIYNAENYQSFGEFCECGEFDAIDKLPPMSIKQTKKKVKKE